MTLDDRETDALRMRRARLDFHMDTLESRTFVRTMEIVARELGTRQGGVSCCDSPKKRRTCR